MNVKPVGPEFSDDLKPVIGELLPVSSACNDPMPAVIDESSVETTMAAAHLFLVWVLRALVTHNVLNSAATGRKVVEAPARLARRHVRIVRPTLGHWCSYCTELVELWLHLIV